ncbi:MAG: matrixin family metalloprotease [Proteobacteria bacterium]|nr:matrixin family metalloprotease [Pseudomonadota bacterium]
MALGLVASTMTGSGVCLAQSPSQPFRQLVIGGHPVKWVPADPAARIVLRYRVVEGEVEQPTAINCRRIRQPKALLEHSDITATAFNGALRAAFQRWEDVAQVQFVEAVEGEKAEILIGEEGEPVGYAFTNLALGEAGEHDVKPIVAASICLNPEKRWKIGFDGNLAVYDLVHTLTHEIGHAIGLDHPDGRGHLMSFQYTEGHEGLTEGDMLGAVALYGSSATGVAATGGREIATGTVGAVRGVDSVARGIAHGSDR